jgi:hypothetical protein
MFELDDDGGTTTGNSSPADELLPVGGAPQFVSFGVDNQDASIMLLSLHDDTALLADIFCRVHDIRSSDCRASTQGYLDAYVASSAEEERALLLPPRRFDFGPNDLYARRLSPFVPGWSEGSAPAWAGSSQQFFAGRRQWVLDGLTHLRALDEQVILPGDRDGTRYGDFPSWAGATHQLTALGNVFFTTPSKLRHDIEQMEYLIERKLLSPDFHALVQNYTQVLEEIRAVTSAREPPCHNGAEQCPYLLNSHQYETIGASYNTNLYLPPDRFGLTHVLNPATDYAALENEYLSQSPGLLVVDDFLSPPALQLLLEYTQTATIFNDAKLG